MIYCPYCKQVEMIELKHDYHHISGNRVTQPVNTILSVLYQCPECGVGIETSQSVRVTPTRPDFVLPIKEEANEGEDTPIRRD